MGSQQHFCLKWNNHQTNLLSVFDDLLQNEMLVDVTLACDGESLKAHKMVLSACSPYFQVLFRENPCKHPIVILKDIKFTDMKALVDFMYKGEVNVSQNQLSNLLKTADILKVKGLTEITEDLSKADPNKSSTLGDMVALPVCTMMEQQPSASVASGGGGGGSPPMKRRRRHRRTSGSRDNSEESVSEAANLEESVASADLPIIPKTEILSDDDNDLQLCLDTPTCSKQDLLHKDSMGDQSQSGLMDRSSLDLDQVNGAKCSEFELDSSSLSRLVVASSNLVLDASAYSNTLTVTPLMSAMPTAISARGLYSNNGNNSSSSSNLLVNSSGPVASTSTASVSNSSTTSVGYQQDRVSKKSTKHSEYSVPWISDEKLSLALNAIHNGMSFRRAELAFGVNHVTLWRYYKKSKKLM